MRPRHAKTREANAVSGWPRLGANLPGPYALAFVLCIPGVATGQIFLHEGVPDKHAQPVTAYPGRLFVSAPSAFIRAVDGPVTIA